MKSTKKVIKILKVIKKQNETKYVTKRKSKNIDNNK